MYSKVITIIIKLGPGSGRQCLQRMNSFAEKIILVYTYIYFFNRSTYI